jgi:hypothetical protein
MQADWDWESPGVVVLFKDGLPTWLTCQIMMRDKAPVDIDKWQAAVRDAGFFLSSKSSVGGGAKIRSVRAVFVRSTKALNTMISFQTALHKTETKALIDSGATENFISPLLLKAWVCALEN